MSTTVLRVRIRLDLHHFVGSGLVSTVEPAPIRISPPPLKDRPGCRKHWTNCVSGQEPGGCSSMRRSARWCMLGTTQGRHTTWTGTSWRGLRRYTHKTSGFKTSGFKTSGFKTSETSGLQNVRFTKCQVYKTSGLQNVRLQKKHPYIFCPCGWWKSAGSVAAMFAGKVMAVFYSLF